MLSIWIRKVNTHQYTYLNCSYRWKLYKTRQVVCNTGDVSVYSLFTTYVCFVKKFQTLVYSHVFSLSPGWLWSSIKLDNCNISLGLLSFDDINQLIDVGMWSTDDCIELPVPPLQVIICSVSILLKDTPHCRRKLPTIQPGVLKVAQKTIQLRECAGLLLLQFSIVDGDLPLR